MKKVILSIIGVVLIIGLFAGAGFAGYRIGYTRGVQASANGDAPLFGRFERFGPQKMPMPSFGKDFDRGLTADSTTTSHAEDFISCSAAMDSVSFIHSCCSRISHYGCWSSGLFMCFSPVAACDSL